MNYINFYNSPLGKITLASNGDALIGLWLEGQKYFCEPLVKHPQNQELCLDDLTTHNSKIKKQYSDVLATHNLELKELTIFELTFQWLDTYFNGKEPDFTPPLSLYGTPFQKMVWEILLTIPYGQTMTYGDIAKRIAEQKGIARMSAQAVGGAVGRNPISIIIPCHRVIGTNGSLTGYAGGIGKKIYLLNLEKIQF